MKNKVFYLGLLCWFLCVQAQAATIVVKDATDSASPTAAGHTLRSAIGAAVDGDVIRFDASLDGVPIVINQNLGAIAFRKSISIIGNGIQKTIIDGDYKSHIFQIGLGWPIVSYRLVMRGITLQNAGNATTARVALNYRGTADIKDCRFYNNYQGIECFNLSSTVLPNTIENVQFVNNILRGAYFDNTVVPTQVRNCLFEGNRTFGLLLAGKAVVANSIFRNNVNTYVSPQSGLLAGSALTTYGEATVINSVFTNNSGIAQGAAISGHTSQSKLNIINSTIVGNTSGNQTSNFGLGGGVYIGTVGTLKNCIVAKNTTLNATPNPSSGNDIYVAPTATFTSLGGNVIGDGTNFGVPLSSDMVGTTAAPLDPLFVDYANGDLRLSPCSPAINISSAITTEQDLNYDLNQDGSINGNISIDYDNNARVVGGEIDAGAYEYQGIINGAPVATFSYLPGCHGSGSLLPNTVNPGGTYSAVGGNASQLVIDANTGVIDLNNSGIGMYTVQYSITNCSGGQVTQTAAVSVYPPANVQIYQQIQSNGGVYSLNTFIQGGSGNYTYSWLLEGVYVSFTHQVLTPCSGKTYLLTVTDHTTGCVITKTYSFTNRWNNCGRSTNPLPDFTRLRTTNVEVTGKDAVYPNPSNGTFTISSAKGGIVRYEVYNMQGQVVANQRMNAQRAVKVALQVKKGVYMLRAYTEDNHVIQEKIVIK